MSRPDSSMWYGAITKEIDAFFEFGAIEVVRRRRRPRGRARFPVDREQSPETSRERDSRWPCQKPHLSRWPLCRSPRLSPASSAFLPITMMRRLRPATRHPPTLRPAPTLSVPCSSLRSASATATRRTPCAGDAMNAYLQADDLPAHYACYMRTTCACRLSSATTFIADTAATHTTTPRLTTSAWLFSRLHTATPLPVAGGPKPFSGFSSTTSASPPRIIRGLSSLCFYSHRGQRPTHESVHGWLQIAPRGGA